MSKQHRAPKSGPMTVKASRKYKITDPDEMQMFIHMKRKGASSTKNGKAYKRREKHQNRKDY